MLRLASMLVAASLMAGCAWFRGGDEESLAGPHAVVVVKNQGSSDVKVNLTVFEGGRIVHQEDFESAADGDTERRVPLGGNATHRIRLAYTMDQDGRAATGTTENSFDPATCPGTYRITFVVNTTGELTTGGSSGVCDA